MAMKRLVSDADRAKRSLAKTDHEVIKAMEAVLRERGVDADMAALLDKREAARQRARKKGDDTG